MNWMEVIRDMDGGDCTGPRYVCHEVRSEKYIVNKHKSKVLNNSNI